VEHIVEEGEAHSHEAKGGVSEPRRFPKQKGDFPLEEMRGGAGPQLEGEKRGSREDDTPLHDVVGSVFHGVPKDFQVQVVEPHVHPRQHLVAQGYSRPNAVFVEGHGVCRAVFQPQGRL